MIRFFFNIFFFVSFVKQSKQGKLEALNQRGQELMRLADSENHSRIDDEITDINNDWKKKLLELENRLETLTILSNHWQDFEKRIDLLESQLNRLEEKISRTEFVVKSKQHLLDTKDIYRVSATFLFTFLLRYKQNIRFYYNTLLTLNKLFHDHIRKQHICYIFEWTLIALINCTFSYLHSYKQQQLHHRSNILTLNILIS